MKPAMPKLVAHTQPKNTRAPRVLREQFGTISIRSCKLLATLGKATPSGRARWYGTRVPETTGARLLLCVRPRFGRGGARRGFQQAEKERHRAAARAGALRAWRYSRRHDRNAAARDCRPSPRA